MTKRGRHITVSDHALLRFLQRAGGLDIERLRLSIETSLERAALLAAEAGETRYRIVADGLTYLVCDDHPRGATVVTITNAGKRALASRIGR